MQDLFSYEKKEKKNILRPHKWNCHNDIKKLIDCIRDLVTWVRETVIHIQNWMTICRKVFLKTVIHIQNWMTICRTSGFT